MCNLYRATNRERLRSRFPIVEPKTWKEWQETIAPLRAGPFIKAQFEVDVGQWGMIPPSSKTREPRTGQGKRMSTNNARRETIATAWTYRFAWSKSQRCLIPAESYDEPYWGTGKNIWWRFSRADGEPWALAGIWNEWTDRETGEVVPNYTMITQNCDAHPLLSLMHRPDPKLPPRAQDKRAVVPIERADWDLWLHGSIEEAERVIGLPDLACIRHGAADPAQEVALPIAA
jgi:putative SOS response-associated peptidase YedK